MIGLLWLAATVAALNRVRGGGCPIFNRLPVHTRIPAAALVAAVSFPVVGPLDAALVGLCYLAWSFPAWGRWYDLGALDTEPNRPPNQFELLIARITDEDAVAFTIRNVVALIPAMVALHPAFILLALFQTAAYGIGWKWGGLRAIPHAEYLTGAIWGVFIWALV